MKYIIPENKLNKIVFKYLDLILKRLEKKKPNFYEGVVFGYPNEEYGILGWENDGTLYIYNMLVFDISETFGLDKYDVGSIIGKWVSDRYKLEVIEINWNSKKYVKLYATDTN